MAQSYCWSSASLHHKRTLKVSHRDHSFCFVWLHFKSWYWNSCEKWKLRWKWKLYQISTYHSINWKQLVPTFEPTMSFCHSSRNDARNINRWILFLSSHDIKAQAFLSLWQLHHSRVWMAFACSKCSNCCLEEKSNWFGYLGGTVIDTLLFIRRKNSFLWKHFTILLWHFLIIWKYFKNIKFYANDFEIKE